MRPVVGVPRLQKMFVFYRARAWLQFDKYRSSHEASEQKPPTFLDASAYQN